MQNEIGGVTFKECLLHYMVQLLSAREHTDTKVTGEDFPCLVSRLCPSNDVDAYHREKNGLAPLAKGPSPCLHGTVRWDGGDKIFESIEAKGFVLSLPLPKLVPGDRSSMP